MCDTRGTHPASLIVPPCLTISADRDNDGGENHFETKHRQMWRRKCLSLVEAGKCLLTSARQCSQPHKSGCSALKHMQLFTLVRRSALKLRLPQAGQSRANGCSSTFSPSPPLAVFPLLSYSSCWSICISVQHQHHKML